MKESRSKLMRLNDAAEQFGVSRRTINRWIAEGKLSLVRMSRRSVFIPPVDIEKVIERRTCTGPSPRPYKKKKPLQ